jgi:hypothetical protein
MKGKRGMKPAFSLKIEEVPEFEEGCLMTLQVFYKVEQEKKRQSVVYHPDFSKITEAVIRYSDIKCFDWKKNLLLSVEFFNAAMNRKLRKQYISMEKM